MNPYFFDFVKSSGTFLIIKKSVHCLFQELNRIYFTIFLKRTLSIFPYCLKTLKSSLFLFQKKNSQFSFLLFNFL
jgi:hypothetical protein